MPELSNGGRTRWQSLDARLQWTCDTCHEKVADGAGYVYVLKEHAPRAPEDVIQWRVTHTACDPDVDCESSWFDVRDARTLDDLILNQIGLFPGVSADRRS